MGYQSPAVALRPTARSPNRGVKSLVRDCLSCVRRTESPWCALDDGDVARIEMAKVCKPYLAGQSIFEQGSTCRGLFCITSGMVALRQTDTGGSSVIIRIAGEKGLLGYRTFFSADAYPVSAEALTPASVCFIPRQVILDIIERNQNVALYFLQRLATDQAAVQDKFLDSSFHCVRDRLVRLVLAFAGRHGVVRQDGSLEIHLPIARKDMAAMIGACTESVIRAMRSLEEKKLAIFEGRMVVIPRPDLLSEDRARHLH